MCLCVCLSARLSIAAFPHYCTDPDVTWRNGRGFPLVVHYWEDLQLVHGFRCYDNIAPNAKCQRVLDCLYSLYVRFQKRSDAARAVNFKLRGVNRAEFRVWDA